MRVAQRRRLVNAGMKKALPPARPRGERPNSFRLNGPRFLFFPSPTSAAESEGFRQFYARFLPAARRSLSPAARARFFRAAGAAFSHAIAPPGAGRIGLLPGIRATPGASRPGDARFTTLAWWRVVYQFGGIYCWEKRFYLRAAVEVGCYRCSRVIRLIRMFGILVVD